MTHDALGLTGDVAPSFVKRFAHLGDLMSEGVKAYVEEVKDGRFPAASSSKKGTGMTARIIHSIEELRATLTAVRRAGWALGWFPPWARSTPAIAV